VITTFALANGSGFFVSSRKELEGFTFTLLFVALRGTLLVTRLEKSMCSSGDGGSG